MSRITNQKIYDLLETVAVQVNSNSIDIAEMRVELAQKVDKADLNIVLGKIRSEIGGLRSELYNEIGGLRSELHTEIRSVREDISDLRADLQEFKQSETEDIFVITQMLFNHDRDIKLLKKRDLVT